MKRINTKKIDSNLTAVLVAVGFMCLMILRDHIQ